jgi:hypothetical protein
MNVGWQRKQYDKSGGKVRRTLKGEKDWSRNDKEAIHQYQERGYDEKRPIDERKAS